jgi:hypothetical protein
MSCAPIKGVSDKNKQSELSVCAEYNPIDTVCQGENNNFFAVFSMSPWFRSNAQSHRVKKYCFCL